LLFVYKPWWVKILYMDEQSLLPLGYATPPPSRPVRPLAIAGIAGTVIFAGMLVGASTNAINGAVSPAYFISVMGWQFVSNVWWASVAQGVLEGIIGGALLSFVFTTALSIITRGSCPYKMAVRWLGRILLPVYGLWAVGGIGGVTLAVLRPQFFQSTFIGVPGDLVQMLRYAWVGGSIWGAYVGGPLAVIVGLLLFRMSWRRMLKRQSGGEG
jgi:hypothetical protein